MNTYSKEGKANIIFLTPDLDYSAYLLLYGLTLYSISQQALDQLEIIQKDRTILRKVR